ncbi:MAG: HAD family hydrolase [Lachnospiraceae bacterium]|nr:HAD family hydrolase [Lachnospiraceae bacterium]
MAGKYELVIFDLDGTLLDTLDDLADSVNAALSAAGYPGRTREEVRNFVGNGIRKLIERSVPADTTEEMVHKVHELFTLHYKEHCADKTKPYGGIPELLHWLREKGVKTAVVSNKADYAVKNLCTQYFPGLLDEAIGERQGIAKKPAPDTVHEVLRILGVEKSGAVYIGDSDVDVETAKNAGLDCIAVEWGFRDKEVLVQAGAEVIVSEPGELEKYL